MIDLRASFHKTLQTYGHDVLLQRRSLDDTVNPHPQKIWSDQLERHTVRHRFGNNAGIPKLMQTQEEGQIHNVDMIYYFKHDVKPREGDRIYEMDDRFKEKLTTLLIDYALPMRGRGGQLVYWVVGSTREEPN